MPSASTFTNSLLGRAEQQRNLQRPGMLPGMLGTQAMAGAMQGGGPQTFGSLGAGFDERRGLSSSGGMLPAFMANGGPAETTGIGPLYMQGGGDMVASLNPTRAIEVDDESGEIWRGSPRLHQYQTELGDMPPGREDTVFRDRQGFLDIFIEPSVPLSQTPETILGWKEPGWSDPSGIDPGLGGSAATATPGGAQDTTGIGAGTYTQEGGARTTAPGDMTTGDIVRGAAGLGISVADFLGGLGKFSGISLPLSLGTGIFNVLRTGDLRNALPFKFGHTIARMFGYDPEGDYRDTTAGPAWTKYGPPVTTEDIITQPVHSYRETFDRQNGGAGSLAGSAWEGYGDWGGEDSAWFAQGGPVKRQGYANGGPAFREGGLATLL